MGKQRPPYPDHYYPILRKGCNFGCAVCGVPIPLTIHHIEGYEDNVVAPIEDLIYLCKEHHKQADDDVIGKPELYQLKKKPYNFNKVHIRLVFLKPGRWWCI